MHALISGAGIAGSTLAWFLARSGARVTVLERSASILPHGQNIDMEGSAVTVIKKMGLMPEIRRLHTTECGTKFVNPDGHSFAAFPVSNGEKFTGTSEFEILRGDLAKILYNAAKEHSNVEYRFATTINKVLNNDETGVTCELSNGEIFQSDILVAADGQWSKVRRQIFDSSEVTVVDKNLTCVYWTMPRIAEDDNWWNVYFGLERRGVSIRPDPHGTVRAMLTCMPKNDEDKQVWLEMARSNRQTQADFLRSRYADIGWQTKRLLDSMEKASDFYFQTIQQIKMSHWSKGRVVCVGDAAHAPTPLTGQGTTLAITGAYILAGELASLQQEDSFQVAFDHYENKFKPHVDKIQHLPFFVPGIMHPNTAWQRLALTYVFRLVKFLSDFSIFQRSSESENHDNGFPCPTYPELDSKLT